MKDKIFKSILKLNHWLEDNNYKAYDPFDGLDSKLLTHMIFQSKPLVNLGLSVIVLLGTFL